MTNLELQTKLAKLLPEKIRISGRHGPVWIKENAVVEETEMLHICWLIEQGMTRLERFCVSEKLHEVLYPEDSPVSASWQQRARAIIAVKGNQ